MKVLIRSLISRDFVSKTFLLGLILLSGVAFSLSLALARVLATERLPLIIQFQTTSVFFAFIVQAGLRAGLRNQFNLGRHRMVKAAEFQIRRSLPFFASVVALLSLFQTRYEIFPAFASLNAVLTLLMTLRISQRRYRDAALYSVVTSLSILLPCIVITFSHRNLFELRIPIELGALVCLFLLSFRIPKHVASMKALQRIFWGSIGLQIGSFATYFLAFLFGQYVLVLTKISLDFAVALADMQVFCGVQGLVFSRILLFYEGRLIEKGGIRALVMGVIAWVLIFTLLVFCVTGLVQDWRRAAIYSAFSLSILGREALALIFQFLNETFRVETLIITAPFALALILAIQWNYSGNWAILLIAIASPTVLSAMFLGRAYLSNRNYFIRASAPVNVPAPAIVQR